MHYFYCVKRTASFPMSAFRRMPNPRVKGIAGIKGSVVTRQCRLGKIKMSDVVFGWIFRTAPIKQFPHFVLNLDGVVASFYNVVLMKNLAEKVPIIQLMMQPRAYRLRQMLEPICSISRESYVQGDNLLHVISMNGAIADRRTGRCKSM